MGSSGTECLVVEILFAEPLALFSRAFVNEAVARILVEWLESAEAEPQEEKDFGNGVVKRDEPGLVVADSCDYHRVLGQFWSILPEYAPLKGSESVGGCDRLPGSSGFGGIVVMHDVEMREEEKEVIS